MAKNKNKASKKTNALLFLLVLVFVASAAWAGYYMVDELRSRKTFQALSDDMALARGQLAGSAQPSGSRPPLNADKSPAALPPQAAEPQGTDPLTTALPTEEEMRSPLPLAPLSPEAVDTLPAEDTAQPADGTPPAEQAPIAPALPQDSPDPLSAYYAQLKQRNEDFGGWIHIDQTVVDYPVMYTPGDLEKYLHRNFEGQYSFAGLPFLDTSYPPDTTGVNQIIYAHNMKSGQMFATLHEYLKDDFWAQYKTLSFHTLDTQRNYEVLALIPLVLGPMDSPRMMIFHPWTTANEQAVHEINDYLSNHARRLDGEVQLGDDLLTLVTCRNARDSDRLILVARRQAQP